MCEKVGIEKCCAGAAWAEGKTFADLLWHSISYFDCLFVNVREDQLYFICHGFGEALDNPLDFLALVPSDQPVLDWLRFIEWEELVVL